MSNDWDEDDSFEEAAPQLQQQQQQVMQAPVLTKGLQAVERPLSAAELLSSDAKSITYETVTHYATLSMTPKELAIHLAKQGANNRLVFSAAKGNLLANASRFSNLGDKGPLPEGAVVLVQGVAVTLDHNLIGAAFDAEMPAIKLTAREREHAHDPQLGKDAALSLPLRGSGITERFTREIPNAILAWLAAHPGHDAKSIRETLSTPAPIRGGAPHTKARMQVAPVLSPAFPYYNKLAAELKMPLLSVSSKDELGEVACDLKLGKEAVELAVQAVDDFLPQTGHVTDPATFSIILRARATRVYDAETDTFVDKPADLATLHEEAFLAHPHYLTMSLNAESPNPAKALAAKKKMAAFKEKLANQKYTMRLEVATTYSIQLPNHKKV